MLIKKDTGNTYSSCCGNTPKKGNKGEMSIGAERQSNGLFSLNFRDAGNYGKVRYRGSMLNLTRSQLLDFIFELETLVHQNEDSSTIEQLTLESA